MLGIKDEKKRQNFVLNKACILMMGTDNKQINKRILECSNCYKEKRMGLYIMIGVVDRGQC